MKLIPTILSSLVLVLFFTTSSSAPSLLGLREGSNFEGTYFQTNTGHPEGLTRVVGRGISLEMDKLYIKAGGGTVNFTPDSIEMGTAGNNWQVRPLPDSFYFNFNKKIALEISAAKDSASVGAASNAPTAFSLFVAGDFQMNLSFFKSNILQLCSLSSSILDKQCSEKQILDNNSIYKASLSRILNLLTENLTAFLSLYDGNHKGLIASLADVSQKVQQLESSSDLTQIKQTLKALDDSLDKLSKTAEENQQALQTTVSSLSAAQQTLATSSTELTVQVEKLQADLAQQAEGVQNAFQTLESQILKNVTSLISTELSSVDQIVEEKISPHLEKLQASSSSLDLKVESLVAEEKEQRDKLSTSIVELDTSFQAGLSELSLAVTKNITNLRESLFISLDLQSDAFSEQVSGIQQDMRRDLEQTSKDVDTKLSTIQETLSHNVTTQLSSLSSFLTQQQQEASGNLSSSLTKLNQTLSQEIDKINSNLLQKLSGELEQTKNFMTTNLQAKLGELETGLKREKETQTSKLAAVEASLKKEEKERDTQLSKLRADFNDSVKESTRVKDSLSDKIKDSQKSFSDDLAKLSSRLDSAIKTEETNRVKAKDETDRSMKAFVESSLSPIKKDAENLRAEVKKNSDKFVEQSASQTQGLKDEVSKREKLESSMKETVSQINNKLKDHESNTSNLEQQLLKLKDEQEKQAKTTVESGAAQQIRFKELEGLLATKLRDLDVSLGKEVEKNSNSLRNEIEKNSLSLTKELDKVSASFSKETSKLSSDLSALSNQIKAEEKERLGFNTKIRDDVDKLTESCRDFTSTFNLKLKDFQRLEEQLKLFSDKATESSNRVEAMIKAEEKERISLGEKLSGLAGKDYEKLEDAHRQLQVENQLLKGANQQLEARLDKLSQEVVELRSLLLSQVGSLVSALVKTFDSKQAS